MIGSEVETVLGMEASQTMSHAVQAAFGTVVESVVNGVKEIQKQRDTFTPPPELDGEEEAKVNEELMRQLRDVRQGCQALRGQVGWVVKDLVDARQYLNLLAVDQQPMGAQMS